MTVKLLFLRIVGWFRRKAQEEEKALREALDLSSAGNGRMMLAFVGLLVYLVVVIWTTTDEQLLRPDSRIGLPFFNLGVTVFLFYLPVPVLLAIMHFYVLFWLLRHREKLDAYDKLVWENLKEKRKGLRFYFLNFAFWEGGSRWVFRFLLWVVVYAAPPVVLLFAQVRFSAYHSLPILVFEFGVLGVDLLVLWFCWDWRREAARGAFWGSGLDASIPINLFRNFIAVHFFPIFLKKVPKSASYSPSPNTNKTASHLSETSTDSVTISV